MYKITVENDDEEMYNAILLAAKVHARGACRESRLKKFTRDSTSLLINQPVAVTGVGLVTPIREGSPQPMSGYRQMPMYYSKVVIETDDESAARAWIEKAVKDYKSTCVNFKHSSNELLVLTWDGEWNDEYRTATRSSVYLPGTAYQDILNDLTTFYTSETDYKRLDIPWTRTYMLHGLPGTGKTSLVYTLASELDKNIALLDFSDPDISDAKIRRALFKLPRGTILCLEDIDALFVNRKSEKSTITFSGLINVLDGVIKNTGLVIFMTTNYIQNIDDTAMRRRVDYCLKFDTMKRDQIGAMFTKFYPDQDVKAFVKRVSSLTLTPCILQKFFVRRLRSTNILADIDELEDMCTNEYKVLVEKNEMYT